MGNDALIEVRVRGMRTLADVRLPLHGLTVLVGENGSGKSTLLEAMELLRAVAEGSAAVAQHFSRVPGGVGSLVRQGMAGVSVGASVRGPEVRGQTTVLEYAIEFAPDGAIASEQLDRRAGGQLDNVFIHRRDSFNFGPEITARAFSQQHGVPALSSVAEAKVGEASTVRSVLAGIGVHPPFPVMPAWASSGPQTTMSTLAPLREARRLERLGENLVSVWFNLRNQSDEHWQETMRLVRLGLGDSVESVVLKALNEGVQLLVKFRGQAEALPASSLSSGMLAFLAWVALVRHNDSSASLIAFDEPELHLHPSLLGRVTALLETLAESQPVVIATHSRRLLDHLTDPLESVVLCDLVEPARATRLRRPDAEMLGRWLHDYDGLGRAIEEGATEFVMTRDIGP